MAQFLQITSATNTQYKIWKSLLTSKGIRENHCFLYMGQKLVAEFLKAPIKGFNIEAILISDTNSNSDFGSHRVCQLSRELFSGLDQLGTKSTILVLSYTPWSTKKVESEASGLELICPIGDPRNMGALVRTAVGFGVREVILTQEATHPFLPHSVKASAGAVLKMKFSSCGPIHEIPLLGNNMALELHGTPLEDIVEWPAQLRLWVGEEGPGLQLSHEQKKKMQFINIPTNNIESLNAMVSTSLALWEWKKNQHG